MYPLELLDRRPQVMFLAPPGQRWSGISKTLTAHWLGRRSSRSSGVNRALPQRRLSVLRGCERRWRCPAEAAVVLQIRPWCSGNTTVSKTVILGSIPSGRAGMFERA